MVPENNRCTFRMKCNRFKYIGMFIVRAMNSRKFVNELCFKGYSEINFMFREDDFLVPATHKLYNYMTV